MTEHLYRPALHFEMSPILTGAHGACANGGPSDTCGLAFIVDSAVLPSTDVEAAREANAPIYVLAVEHLAGENRARLRPVYPAPEGGTGWMASGAWIVPTERMQTYLRAWGVQVERLTIHDRAETWDLYNRLSSD